MDRLPDEIVRNLFFMLNKGSNYYAETMKNQANQSAFLRTGKRFHRIGTELPLEAPTIDMPQRIRRFEKTCLARLNPFTLARGGEQPVPKIQEIWLVQKDRLEPKSCTKAEDFVLPPMWELRRYGCFDNLRTLVVSGWFDNDMAVPELLAPLTPLRAQLRRLEYESCDYDEHVSIVYTFLLDATVHVPAWVFRLNPLSTRMTTDDVAELDPEETAESLSRNLARSRADLRWFCSDWDESLEYGSRQIIRRRDLLQRPIEDHSPFECLTTLVLAIHTELQLLLLLATGNVRNLRHLIIRGCAVDVSIEHLQLLRRSITMDGEDWYEHGLSGYFEGTMLHESVPPPDLFTAIPGELWAWSSLNQKEIDEFGVYLGPRLRVFEVDILITWHAEGWKLEWD